MAKDKKSERKKDGADEKMDKELLDEIARAENEGFSMSQYLIDNKKSFFYRTTITFTEFSFFGCHFKFYGIPGSKEFNVFVFRAYFKNISSFIPIRNSSRKL